MKSKILFASALSLMLVAAAQAESLQERIAPVGQVRVTQAAAPAAAAPAPVAEAAPAPAAEPEVQAAEAPAAEPETPTAEEAPAAETQVAEAAGRDGKTLYDTKCFICHTSGAAGAPKLGDKAAWEPRIANGMDALMNTAVNGRGAMPPRGTCADCTDAELKGAIEYMVSQVQ